jgi:hypothetical protein
VDLSDLNKKGWFLAPGETVEGLLERKGLFEDQSPASFLLLEKAGKITELLYGFKFETAPIFYSNKSLFPWQGGMLWSYFSEKGKCFPKVQMRTKYSKRYDPTEILAHELVHMARFAFKEPLFEEILAYKTSKSAFRRFLGPLFIYPLESVIFMSLSLLGSFSFVWLETWLSFLPFALFFVFLFIRLSALHIIFNRAVQKSGESSLKSMIGLSDKEIIKLGMK